MKIQIAVVIAILGVVNAYSKYGRTCKDIGCMANEVCVMAEDPCRRRDEPCGEYPTCQRVSNQKQTCSTFVCPPTTVCVLDRDRPKCVDETSDAAKHKPSNSHEPSAPNLYPQVPRGETSTRPPVYRQGYPSSGGGYQGGQIGSGYPGQTNNNGYPGQTNNNGYPGQTNNNGYPNQNYPYNPSQNNYPGYPNYNQNGGYPMQPGYTGYNQPGYNQGGNTGYNQGGYNRNPANQGSGGTSSNPLFGKITDTLKNIGTKFLKDALGNLKL